jgi:hypothetical protein
MVTELNENFIAKVLSKSVIISRKTHQHLGFFTIAFESFLYLYFVPNQWKSVLLTYIAFILVPSYSCPHYSVYFFYLYYTNVAKAKLIMYVMVMIWDIVLVLFTEPPTYPGSVPTARFQWSPWELQ